MNGVKNGPAICTAACTAARYTSKRPPSVVRSRARMSRSDNWHMFGGMGVGSLCRAKNTVDTKRQTHAVANSRAKASSSRSFAAA